MPPLIDCRRGEKSWTFLCSSRQKRLQQMARDASAGVVSLLRDLQPD